jgi:hypothetical protein
LKTKEQAVAFLTASLWHAKSLPVTESGDTVNNWIHTEFS